MRLAYVYLKSYGHVRNQEINLDPDWRFAFDGNELTAVRQTGIPPHFFSLVPDGNEVVESVSALVGENGAGKTSIARFLSEFLSETGVSRDFLVIVFVDGQYFAFYNFYDIHKPGFGRQFDLIPESNRFNLSERDNQLSTWRDSVLERLNLVYLSPHFTATPIFNSTSKRVVDCSTAGLLAGMGRYGDGMMPVGKFALHEQLSALRVIGAYVTKEDAPSEPGEILRRSDMRISWVKGTLNMPQRLSVAARRGRDEFYLRTGEVIKELLRSPLVQGGSASAFTKTFGCFAAAFVRSRMLALTQHAVDDKEFEAWVGPLCALCEEFLACGDDYRRARDLIMGWLDRGRVGPDMAPRRRGLRQLLEGMEWLGGNFGMERRGNSILIPVSQSEELAKRMLAVVEGYLNCVGRIDFLGFEFFPRLSSGEMSFLSMWGRLYEFVREHESERRKYDVMVFLDESETALHPSWQRKLVWYTIWFFEHFAPHARAHLLFASHSPILLSDIPKSNVHFMFGDSHKRGRQQKELARLVDTFAANVFDLYRLSFFMNEGTVGKFASMKVNGLLRNVSSRKELFNDQCLPVADEDMERIVKLIGDPFIRHYLIRRLGIKGEEAED